MLDEPTNDLDENTNRALENFAGCAVVASHGRWFLDRLATHILSFEGDFPDYEEAKRVRLADVEFRSWRYKKLG